MAEDAAAPVRIGIVVPALDEATGIGATLATACLDDPRVAACVVADGGSRDDTAAIACAAGAVVVTAARGRGRQLRAGWQALPPGLDAVLMLHADTRLPAGWIDAVEGALGRRDGAARAAWGAFDVVLDGSPTLRLVAGAMNLRSRLTGVCTGDQAIFARSDALAAIDGPPDWPLMEDIGLSDALRRRVGPPARPRLAVHTSARRWQRDGPWRTIASMWWLRARHALGASPQALHRAYYGRPAPAAPAAATAAAIVFTRLPEPGRVKRRLAAGLGETVAYHAYCRLLERALDAVDGIVWPVAAHRAVANVPVDAGANADPDADADAQADPPAAAAGGCERILCVEPPPPGVPARVLAAQLAPWLRPGWTLRWQRGADLGARMHAALLEAAGAGRPAVLLGGDCPQIDAATLERALAALATHDLTFVPTEDGGYGLVGLRHACAQAFEGVEWGRPDVMARTRARLSLIGRRWHEAAAVRDIDEPQDWTWWVALADA